MLLSKRIAFEKIDRALQDNGSLLENFHNNMI